MNLIRLERRQHKHYASHVFSSSKALPTGAFAHKVTKP